MRLHSTKIISLLRTDCNLFGRNHQSHHHNSDRFFPKFTYSSSSSYIGENCFLKSLKASASPSSFASILSNRTFGTASQLRKFVPDKSRVPRLREQELEEQFVQGSGPGGQNVNRLQNCVVLRHTPTGIVVKCHEDRQLHRNRKLARQLMIDRLDQHFNGENSLHEQKKRYIVTRKADRDRKAADLRDLKKKYRENLRLLSKQTNSATLSPPAPNLEISAIDEIARKISEK